MATRKKTRKDARKVFAAAAAYLDPQDCESIVAYKVVRNTRQIFGCINIVDCNRKIELYIHEKTPIAKVDTLIEALTAFRAAVIAARATRRTVPRRTKGGGR